MRNAAEPRKELGAAQSDLGPSMGTLLAQSFNHTPAYGTLWFSSPSPPTVPSRKEAETTLSPEHKWLCV